MLASNRCPYCGQPISNELEQKLNARAEKEMREQLEAAREQAKLEQEKLVKKAVEAARTADQEKIAESERRNKALQASIDERIDAERAASAEKIAESERKNHAETQKLKKQIEIMQRDLEAKTNAERRKQAEQNLLETLEAAFPHDDVRKVKGGAKGGDALQIVRCDGQECERILYESKDTKTWDRTWIAKLLDDQKREGAGYAVLSTSALPNDTQQVHVIDGVYVTKPENVIFVASTLRHEIIKRASQPDVERADNAELLKYMIGDGQQRLDEWRKLNSKSRELTQAMKDSHKKVENARDKHDASLEAEYYGMQAELDDITKRNRRNSDDDSD